MKKLKELSLSGREYKIMYSLKLFGPQNYYRLVETAGIATLSSSSLNNLYEKSLLRFKDKEEGILELTVKGENLMEELDDFLDNNCSDKTITISNSRQSVYDRYFKGI